VAESDIKTMTITVIPWFREVFADFLKMEESPLLKTMGKRFEDTFVDNQWRDGGQFFILDFHKDEIELLIENNGFQRLYDYMKVVRKESRQKPHCKWMYGYITYRLGEFAALAAKITQKRVKINTKRVKKMPGMHGIDQMSAEYGGPGAEKKEIPPVITLEDTVKQPRGCPDNNYKIHKDNVQRTLDELQACIVLAGGKKFSIQELAAMPLGEALFMCFPNGIRIKAALERLPRTTPLLT